MSESNPSKPTKSTKPANSTKPNKYERGKIYRIWSPSANLTYVGSTIQLLSKRLGKHRENKRNFEAGKYQYTSSYDVIQHPDHRIELIEKYPCQSKEELRRREGHFIRKLECVNKRIAGRTDKEYYEDNKEALRQKRRLYEEANREKRKEYRERNKDRIKQRSKLYREQNKDKIRQRKSESYQQEREHILERVKARYENKKDEISAYAKRYREANNEKLQQQKRDYYNLNKERIKAKNKVKAICPVCGESIRKGDMIRHQRTKKCQASNQQALTTN